MRIIDGPTLRAVREAKGVPLRKIASASRMSHGHMSRVERGDYGRPVTPAILKAYETVLGPAALETNTQYNGWRPGQLPEGQRRRHNARVAAISVGGLLTDTASGVPEGTRLKRLLEYRCQLTRPDVADEAAAAQIAVVARFLDALSGETAGLIARAVLWWASDLIHPYEEQRPDLYVAISLLALRAGLAAIELDGHEQARELLVIALYGAVSADAPDLRARVLATVAVHYASLDHPADALTVLRLAETDERVEDDSRKLLNEVRGRVESASREATGRLNRDGES